MQESHTMSKKIDSFWSFFSDEALYTEWLSKNWKNLLISIGCLAMVLVIGLRLSFGSSGQKAGEYLKAEQEFATFQTSEGAAQTEAFTSLEQILQTMPQLHAKYDGALAQELLLQNNEKKAAEFACLTLLRTERDNLPLYGEYSRISLLISQGDYRTALDRTVQLKNKMTESSRLLAYTLLNQALLYQQTVDLKGEKAAWAELKSRANEPAFAEMFAQFEMGRVSLNDYIEIREKV